MFNLFRPSSCRAQFEKVGLGSDECIEVLERLLDIKYKWVIFQFKNWSSFYLLNYFFSFLLCLSYLIISLMNFICSYIHRYEPSTDFWGTNFKSIIIFLCFIWGNTAFMSQKLNLLFILKVLKTFQHTYCAPNFFLLFVFLMIAPRVVQTVFKIIFFLS